MNDIERNVRSCLALETVQSLRLIYLEMSKWERVSKCLDNCGEKLESWRHWLKLALMNSVAAQHSTEE